MTRGQKIRTAATTVGTVMGILLAGTATPALARTVSMKDAGPALWIFMAVGAIIVLLQLIPAVILFFSFIGTTSAVVFKGKKAAEESREIGPEYEPAVVKK